MNLTRAQLASGVFAISSAVEDGPLQVDERERGGYYCYTDKNADNADKDRLILSYLISYLIVSNYLS